VVATVEEGAAARPTTAPSASPPRAAARPSGASVEELHRGRLDVENGLHEFLGDDAELSKLAPRPASSCATCAARPPI
jgi:hypothetical protein